MVLKETKADYRGFRKYYNKPALIGAVSKWISKSQRWSALSHTGLKRHPLISAVSEWVQKTSGYQRHFRKSLKKQSLTTAASECFFLKKRGSPLIQDGFKKTSAVSEWFWWTPRWLALFQKGLLKTSVDQRCFRMGLKKSALISAGSERF